jgi:hypothetical protein
VALMWMFRLMRGEGLKVEVVRRVRMVKLRRKDMLEGVLSSLLEVMNVQYKLQEAHHESIGGGDVMILLSNRVINIQ